MFHIEPKAIVQKSTSQENMYEKVIYRFFDETPSMIEETSQEDEESKTYSRVDTHQRLSLMARSGHNSECNTPVGSIPPKASYGQ